MACGNVRFFLRASRQGIGVGFSCSHLTIRLYPAWTITFRFFESFFGTRPPWSRRFPFSGKKVPSLREAFRAAVEMATVELKYCSTFVVIPIHGVASDDPLPSVTTQLVVDMDISPLGLGLDPIAGWQPGGGAPSSIFHQE